MAGTLVSDYAVGDVDLTALMDTVTKQRVDFEAVTLTNHDNGSEPAIAAGSMLNVNGALYQFSSETAISGSATSGLNYIKFVVSGSSCTPTWTTTAPTWSDSKQGWYSGNDRYLFTCDYDGSSVYSNKMKLLPEQWPEFLKPAFIARQTKDLELDGTTVEQRVIYCRNFHVTANTTLKARTVWVEGDLTIDSGVTLTISPLESNNYGDEVIDLNAQGNGYLRMDTLRRPGAGFATGEPGGSTHGGLGGFGGGDGDRGVSDAGGGGGGFGTGGVGQGVAGGVSNGIDIGNGGAGSTPYNPGGGACCAGGGRSVRTGAQSGQGGELIFFIVKGNFINDGTITNPGGNGGTASGYAGAGGGAGVVVIIAFGSSYTGGTINCIGGNGGNTTQDGAGGAGGGVFEVAKTASFATVDVSGGSGYSAADGGTGTTETYDISDGTTENIFGSADGDADAILPQLLFWVEGGQL